MNYKIEFLATRSIKSLRLFYVKQPYTCSMVPSCTCHTTPPFLLPLLTYRVSKTEATAASTTTASNICTCRTKCGCRGSCESLHIRGLEGGRGQCEGHCCCCGGVLR